MAARRAHRNLLALLACALVAVTLSLTWAPRVARADRSYDVSRVDIDATVDADGLLHVTETRTFDFDGSFNGVYWDIPVGHNASNGADVEVSDVSASVGGTPLEESGSGAAGTFEVSDQGAGIKRLKLFWPSSDESVSFTISYVASGVATRWQDTGELYWKFVSDGWDVSSDNVTCTLHLPVPSGESVAPGDNVRAWGHGPLDASVSFYGGDVAFSVPGVGTREFAEMRVTFPAGWLSGLEETQGEELPDILSEEQAWSDEANARRTAARVAVYGGTAAGVAVAVGTLAFAARNRLRYARDFRPRFTDPYFRDVPTADHPAVLGALANGGKAQAKELTATLMRLTDEGVVRLDKVTTRSRGAFGRERASEDYRLTQVGELGPAHGPAGSWAREIDARALEFLFGTVGRAVVLVDDVALAVDNDGVRNHLCSESAFEVAVRIEQHLVGPAVVVDKRFHLVYILCLVDGHGDDFHAGLLLPFVVDFGNGTQFAVARFAPGGEKVDDKRFATVRQCVGSYSLSVDALERYRRKLCLGCHNDTKEQCQCQ